MSLLPNTCRGLAAFMEALILIFTPEFLYPSHDKTVQGARAISMGNASVTTSDFWSLHNNQAGLAGLKSTQAGIFCRNFYLVGEMNFQSAGVAIPSGRGALGLSMSYFGYSQYSEKKIGLAYSHSLRGSLSAGIQLDYLHTHISEGYGNNSHLTCEAGMIAKLSEELTIAAHVFNPLMIGVRQDEEERIPVVFIAGFSWRPSGKIITVIEAEKHTGYKPAIRAGMEYLPDLCFRVRLGYTTPSVPSGSVRSVMASMFTFGAGYTRGRFEVSLAATLHQAIGWSPAFSAVYSFR
ncbi:MAG: hypothetical protein JW861_02110 [Bacteroidales bacterium]|nr:hypothetical protein [Bacteroidales bacterium]